MALGEPFPGLDEILASIGAGGKRLATIDAAMVPGSRELMEANVESLRRHRIVIWAKHGVMARSDISVTRAVDRIEYAETAARFEYMDLVNGARADGLTIDEMRAVVEAFDVRTTIL